VVGTVEAVSEDTLTLRNRLDESHDFALDESTKFTQGGRSISREQIQEGAKVRAAFRTEGGKLHATEIKLQRASQQDAAAAGSRQESGSQGTGSSQQSGSSSQDAGSQQSGSSSQDAGSPPQGGSSGSQAK
jgi:activator of HSP90 ATPase